VRTLARILDGAASAWLLFWAGLTAVYVHAGGLAFAGLAALLGGVGWIVWLAHARDVPVLDRSVLLAFAAFAAFFAWLGFTGTFSGAGPQTAGRLALLMGLSAAVPALMLTRTERVRDWLAGVLMATAVLGAAVLLLDVATGYSLSMWVDPVGSSGGDPDGRRGEVEMTIGRAHVSWILLTPLLLALFATRLKPGTARLAAAAFLVLLLAGTGLNGLAIVPLVLLGMIPFGLVAFRAPVLGLRLSLGALILSILGAPLIGLAASTASETFMARLPMSWDHRLRMWDYGWTMIRERPWQGFGLDVSRGIEATFMTRIGVEWPIVSLHPHNVGMQTWMEAGGVGAALLSLALLSLFPLLRRLAANDPWRATALSGLFAGVAIGGMATVGAWQYWWWGLIALAAAWTLLIPVTRRA
ncbi:MAG: O-antigen ligase family protein, partial [Litorimonas sp.]